MPAAEPAELMRSVTVAGLGSCGRLTLHLSRQRMPFRGRAEVCVGCASASTLTSVPLNWPDAVVPATGARRAWTGIAVSGTAPAAVPAAIAAATTPTRKAPVPAVRVLITVHLLGLAVPESNSIVGEIGPRRIE